MKIKLLFHKQKEKIYKDDTPSLAVKVDVWAMLILFMFFGHENTGFPRLFTVCVFSPAEIGTLERDAKKVRKSNWHTRIIKAFGNIFCAIIIWSFCTITRFCCFKFRRLEQLKQSYVSLRITGSSNLRNYACKFQWVFWIILFLISS